MATIPQELRDVIVDRLEGAVRQRDDVIDRLRGSVGELEAQLGAVSADADRARAASQSLRRQLDATRQQLTSGAAEAQQRLDRIRADLDAQRGRIEAQLEEIRDAHQRELATFEARLHEEIRQRRTREAAARQRAREWLAEARTIIEVITDEDRDAMDLVGEHNDVRGQIARAAATVMSEADSAEQAMAASGALVAARRVHGLVKSRMQRLAQCSGDLNAAADWLTSLASGAATEQLQEQSADIQRMLARESALVRAAIERHVRGAAEALTRWNGHGAGLAKAEAIVALLTREILQARLDLPDSVAYETDRYEIGWLLDCLAMRFGRIRDDGDCTAGAWEDPDDIKSPYAFYLMSTRGELILVVPWTGLIRVVHAGSRWEEAAPLSPIAQAVARTGRLKERWTGLNDALANPAQTASSIEALFGYEGGDTP